MVDCLTVDGISQGCAVGTIIVLNKLFTEHHSSNNSSGVCVLICMSFPSLRSGAWWQHILLHPECGTAPGSCRKPPASWSASSWHAVTLPNYQHFTTLSDAQTRLWASRLRDTRLKVWHLPSAVFCSSGGSKGLCMSKYPDHLHLSKLPARDGSRWGWS